MLAINLRGTFLVTQAVLAGMLQRRFGRIVSASSISAERGGGTLRHQRWPARLINLSPCTRATLWPTADAGRRWLVGYGGALR